MNSRALKSAVWDEDPERKLLMELFFEGVNNFMSARHGYKKHKCLPWISKVDARCSKFSLTLGFRHDNSVGISAIRFRDKRRGHCAALIEFIDQISYIYHIPCIEFISVLTEPMKNFVMKNHFTNRDSYHSFIEDLEVSSQNWYRDTPFYLKKEQVRC